MRSLAADRFWNNHSQANSHSKAFFHIHSLYPLPATSHRKP